MDREDTTFTETLTRKTTIQQGGVGTLLVSQIIRFLLCSRPDAETTTGRYLELQSAAPPVGKVSISSDLSHNHRNPEDDNSYDFIENTQFVFILK